MTKENKGQDLSDRVRAWYISYNGVPPWSAMVGFIIRENKKQKQEIVEEIKKAQILADEEQALKTDLYLQKMLQTLTKSLT